MAIFFHEGLPRSGKSYETVVEWIIPAIAKGRKVHAYVDGLNHQKIAELAGVSLEQCQALLFQIEEHQVKTIYNHVTPDSLIVIDEIQDFFPSTREKPPEPISKFVSRHGHDGQDIIIMGQNINDVHQLWRNRCAQKNVYFKREALGKPDEYTVTIFKPVISGDKLKWKEVSVRGPFKYDPKYFGTYKSHNDETTNKDTLVDQRAVIWNNPFFKKWLPLYGVVLVLAVGYIVYAFSGGLAGGSEPDKQPKKQSYKAQPSSRPAPVHKPEPSPSKPQPPAIPSNSIKPKSFAEVDAPPIPDEAPDLIDNLSASSRIRFAGYIRMGDRVGGYIEWRNDSFGLVERLSLDDLQGLGWMVLVNQTGTLAVLQRYSRRYIATIWPLPDPQGKLTTAQNDAIKPSN